MLNKMLGDATKKQHTQLTNSVVSALQVLYFYQALPKSYQESLLTQCQRCKRPISPRSFCNAVFFSFSNAACTREKSDSASPSCSSKLRSRARCCFSFASWSGETDGISTRQATFLQSLVVDNDGARGKTYMYITLVHLANRTSVCSS